MPAEVEDRKEVIDWEPTVESLPEVDAPETEDVEAAEEAVEAVETPEPEQNKEYVNVQARARILERERDAALRDRQILEGRLNQLLTVWQQNMANATPHIEAAEQRAEQPKAPNFEEDPAGALMWQIRAVDQKLEAQRQEQLQAAQMGTISQQLAYADMMVQQRAKEDPVNFAGAINHLSKIVQANTQDEYPNLTEEEQIQIATRAIQAKKLEWIAKGKNPADEYMKMATRMGYVPTQNVNAPQVTPVAKTDARAQIKEEKERDNRAASIAKTKGSPAKQGLTAKMIKDMDDASFNRLIDDSLSNGSMTRQSGKYGKTPSFAELLPGKGRPAGGGR